MQRIDDDLDNAYKAEMRTLYLRTVWFPTAEFAYVLPVAASLAWGGYLVSTGHATIGEVTAVALYVVKLADPVDRLISWLDEIQVGATSFARLVGIARVPPDREAKDDEPEDDQHARGGRALRLLRGPRRPARDRPRSRAGRARRRRRPLGRGQVDARAAARRGSIRRGSGVVEVGGVRLVDLPLDTLRKEVALVTQEQHVFVGTLGREPPPRAARTRPRNSSSTRSLRSTRSSGCRRCRSG